MSLKVNKKQIDIFHKDIQNKIIEDIKEMDSDSLIELIEHLYPVIVEFNEDCETIKIKVNENEAPGCDLKDIF